MNEKLIAYNADLLPQLHSATGCDGRRANTTPPVFKVSGTSMGHLLSQIAGRGPHMPEQSVPISTPGHGSSGHFALSPAAPELPAAPGDPPSVELSSPPAPPGPSGSPLIPPAAELPPTPQSHADHWPSARQACPPLHAAGPTHTRVSPALHASVARVPPVADVPPVPGEVPPPGSGD